MRNLTITSSIDMELSDFTIKKGAKDKRNEVEAAVETILKEQVTDKWTATFEKGLHVSAFEPRLKMVGGIIAN